MSELENVANFVAIITVNPSKDELKHPRLNALLGKIQSSLSNIHDNFSDCLLNSLIAGSAKTIQFK